MTSSKKPLGKGAFWNKVRNSRYALLLTLLFLLVYAVGLGDWVEFLGFVLLARVLLVLVIKTSVVGMTFPDAIFVAY